MMDDEAKWLDPVNAPEVGAFLARFESKNDKVRIVVLERKRTATGGVIGVAGGLFAWDIGELTGWYPLPKGLIE